MSYFSKYFLDYHNLNQEMINKEFINACARGNIEQIKYLTSSDELEIKADYLKQSVINSAFRVSILLEKEDSIRYLINDLQIEKSEDIEKNLETNPNPLALSLFLNRDIKSSKSLKNKRNKI